MVHVVEMPDVWAFEHIMGDLLLQREAENQFLLAELLGQLQTPRNVVIFGRQPKFFVIKVDDQISAGAILTREGILMLSWCAQGGLMQLAQHLSKIGTEISMIFGAAVTSALFTRIWREISGQHCQPNRGERVYQINEVVRPRGVAGRLSLATRADAQTLIRWIDQFCIEAHFENSRPAHALFEELLASRSLFVWRDENNLACSMAAAVSPTPHGTCINLVYTPQEHRRRGYASACVAALADLLLSEGRHHCFILVEPEDIALQALYEKIGARFVVQTLRCSRVQPAGVEPPNDAALREIVIQPRDTCAA